MFEMSKFSSPLLALGKNKVLVRGLSAGTVELS